MMGDEKESKRARASRQNGRSGGVKSVEGKTSSRMNAMKHGILASITTGYDLIDVSEIYRSLADEFGADTPSRQILIEQLALTVVRLARCARAESEMLREGLATRLVGNPLVTVEREFEACCPEESKAKLSMDFLERLAPIVDRYEPRLVSRMLCLMDALKAGERNDRKT